MNKNEEQEMYGSPEMEYLQYQMENPKEEYLCPFCNKPLSNQGVICPCEVAPKYDADYEEWKNK